MFLCQFAQPPVDDGCVLLVALRRVEFHDLGNRRIAPSADKFPINLDYGTVYLDSQEILRFSGNGDGGLESDSSLDTADSAVADEGVARP